MADRFVRHLRVLLPGERADEDALALAVDEVERALGLAPQVDPGPGEGFFFRRRAEHDRGIDRGHRLEGDRELLRRDALPQDVAHRAHRGGVPRERDRHRSTRARRAVDAPLLRARRSGDEEERGDQGESGASARSRSRARAACRLSGCRSRSSFHARRSSSLRPWRWKTRARPRRASSARDRSAAGLAR